MISSSLFFSCSFNLPSSTSLLFKKLFELSIWLRYSFILCYNSWINFWCSTTFSYLWSSYWISFLSLSAYLFKSFSSIWISFVSIIILCYRARISDWSVFYWFSKFIIKLFISSFCFFNSIMNRTCSLYYWLLWKNCSFSKFIFVIYESFSWSNFLNFVTSSWYSIFFNSKV